MSAPPPSFFARLGLAFAAFFRALGDADYAASLRDLRLPAPEPEPEPDTLREAPEEAALQLLAALQRKGRFLDFLEEDVSAFSDAEIGAAARVVHEGAKRAIDEIFEVAPIRSEEEGAEILLEADYDAQAVRVVGDVRGDPPFRGSLSHAGWRVLETHLPKLAEGHDARVIAPAEVEL
ncbi:MAG: DUF2760 domain-containing protein [Deltaproteobacteria bacterium]|nr:DUF2760 domain-containing protein [Deltaproteobacteria bacterium]